MIKIADQIVWMVGQLSILRIERPEGNERTIEIMQAISDTLAHVMLREGPDWAPTVVSDEQIMQMIRSLSRWSGGAPGDLPPAPPERAEEMSPPATPVDKEPGPLPVDGVVRPIEYGPEKQP